MIDHPAKALVLREVWTCRIVAACYTDFALVNTSPSSSSFVLKCGLVDCAMLLQRRHLAKIAVCVGQAHMAAC